MQSILKTDVLDDVEAIFLLPEIQCPVCEFYDIEEEGSNYHCSRCGENWKILNYEQ